MDGKKTKVPLVTEDLRVGRVGGQGPAGSPGGAVTCQLASHYASRPAAVSYRTLELAIIAHFRCIYHYLQNWSGYPFLDGFSTGGSPPPRNSLLTGIPTFFRLSSGPFRPK